MCARLSTLFGSLPLPGVSSWLYCSAASGASSSSGPSAPARLTRCAFAIHVILPPMVVAVTLAWRGVEAPVLVKFALRGSVACMLCYLLSGLLLKLPGVNRVL